MGLFDILRNAFGGKEGVLGAHAVEIIRPNAASGAGSLEHQVEVPGPLVQVSTLPEETVYGLFLDAFVCGKQVAAAMSPADERNLAPLEAFVRDVFSPAYVVKLVGSVSYGNLLSSDGERQVFSHLRQGKEHLKMPNKDGVRDFFIALYAAEVQGRRTTPPIVAHERFRPDIVWMIREGVFGGGLGLVKTIANYGDAYWERTAAEQLLFMYGLAQKYGPEVQGVIHQDLFDAVKHFRDQTRRRAGFLRAQGELGRADELERNYLSTAEQLGMPLPIRALRLSSPNAHWQ